MFRDNDKNIKSKHIDHNQWFRSDSSRLHKRSFYHAFRNKLRRDKRLYMVVMSIFILFIGGAVYAMTAIEPKIVDTSGQRPEIIQIPDDSSKQIKITDCAPADCPPPPSPSEQSNTTGQNAPATASNQVPVPIPAPQPDHKTYTINYGNSCYDPSNQVVNNGDTIVIKNDGKRNMRPVSDSRSRYNSFTDFGAKSDIKPDSSYSYTFKKTGTLTFHDRYKTNCKGTVTVK